MKTTAIAFLAFAALLAPSPVIGREAMLGDESTGQRRLGFFDKGQEYYESLWYRCCGTDGQAGDESKNNIDWQRDDAADNGYDDTQLCKCPVRGSDSKGWSWWSSQTYFEKWEDKCAPGGSIARKAKKGNFGE
eukprot:CAMPEP_0201917260 /NCGR_PEP_ID=MMETSP0903-20130614/6680_1 /ASSEMBLY_ACC=CAM_ASM_000552 /TAXON_ID=420261 /ORGANISM="Thalassiosira antarctica, Strain CCMP982" /LENGTH=132 /DNA_ID=CAMNT_0048453281 /DNA_START=163 /DNA_END=561 /DNA_ORIENTATION=+